RQNIFAWAIVWSLVLLSLALTAATLFPQLSTKTIGIGLAAGLLIGMVGGAAAVRTGRREPAAVLTRTERRALRERDLADWSTPNVAALERPTMSPTRRAGLLTLRTYLVVAVVLVVVKIVQTGMS
ncbi:MAG: manganese transporter, partial [Mycobacterium gordonae]|nr:manganese transporter [Mycobacterium gordonae]